MSISHLLTKQTHSMRWSFFIFLAVSGVSLVGLSGCKKQTTYASSDKDVAAITSVILAVGGSTSPGDKDRFEKLFVSGGAPSEEEKKKYAGGRNFSLVQDSTTVTGNTATCSVEVLDKDYNTEATVTWTFEKVGEDYNSEAGAWKIKDAPVGP